MSLFSKLLLFFLFNLINSLLFPLYEGDERCLIDEFYEDSYFVIKYKVYAEDRRDFKKYLKHFRIYIKDAESNLVLDNRPVNDVKDKITQKVSKFGLYKICIAVNPRLPEELQELNIFGYLKIGSDNMDKTDMTNVIDKKDIYRMKRKSDTIVNLIEDASEVQKERAERTSENSYETLSNARIYKYFNLGQVIISVIIGLIHLLNFKKFLKSKNIV